MANTDLERRFVPAIRQALIRSIREQPDLSLADLVGYKDHFLAPILSTIRVDELIGGVSSPRAGRPRGPGRPPKAAAGTKAGRGRRATRSKADDGAVGNKIMQLLGDAKGPMRSEQLRKIVGGSPAELRRVLDSLRASGKIKRKGQRRGTSYSLR